MRTPRRVVQLFSRDKIEEFGALSPLARLQWLARAQSLLRMARSKARGRGRIPRVAERTPRP